MTDPISNERLVEMLAEVEIEFDNALSDAETDQNPQLAVDPVGEFDLIELRSILTEIQSRRQSPAGVEYVRADTAEGNSFDALLIAGADLLSALERYGFPVSAAATTGLMERGSIEAQRLHRAALGFRDAMSKEPPQWLS